MMAKNDGKMMWHLEKEEQSVPILVEDEYIDDGFEITRFKYMKGLKCRKLLWILCNESRKIPPYYDCSKGLPYDEEAVLELAHALCPDIISFCADDNLEKILLKRKPIFRGVVSCNNISATIDILRPTNDGKWDIVQISLNCKQSIRSNKALNRLEQLKRRKHIQDITFQRYCCEMSNVSIRGCYLAQLNGNYVRKGVLDERILIIDNLTAEVDVECSALAPRINAFLRVAELPECPTFKMFDGETDCLSHSHLTELHCPIIEECREEVDGKRPTLPEVDAADFDISAAKDIFERITYPLHIVESRFIRRAIPLEGSQPYELLPFALSVLSVIDLDYEPTYNAWLWDGKEDPFGAMLDCLMKWTSGSGAILCEFGKSTTDNIMEVAKRNPEHLSILQTMVSQTFELEQTIKQVKRAELAFNGVYYLDFVFPESCKGVSSDDDDIERWMFIKSLCGNFCLNFEEIRLTISKTGDSKTRRVLSYLLKLSEVCYND